MHLMGGKISVQSTLGQGSIFTVNLPFETVTVEVDALIETPWQLPPNHTQTRILIVEDDDSINRFLVQLLSQVGFQVQSTLTGEDAIAQWKIHQPNLMLIDLQLPGIDGYAIAQQIRTAKQQQELHHSEVEDTILIALTANVFQADQASIFAAGFDDVVWKPFREATLLTKIGQHLEICYIPRTK
jgi:adenylate cyclase